MTDNPRIEELRLRVEKDPASIAFAQLAEEYRRAGSYEEAVAACRIGLETHPSYLSARVTLGRALIEMNALEEAEVELLHVLQHAPENLAGIRGLAEIHHRRGELDQALVYYRSALGLARHDPDLEQTIDDISRAVAPAPRPVSDGMTFEEAKNELEEFLDSFSTPAPRKEPEETPAAIFSQEKHVEAMLEPESVPEPNIEFDPEPEPALQALANPALLGLERFLDQIHTYRQRRAV